jgi:pimeloyl-ACP methyl ester carboxylesterase
MAWHEGRRSTAVSLAITVLIAGCTWPRVVPVSPNDPLYASGFPLVGTANLDAALCSLSSVGGDIARLVSPPDDTSHALSLDDACPAQRSADGPPLAGVLVETSPAGGDLGFRVPIRGYLHAVPDATGILVLFAGLAMPSDGWINERFTEWAASRGYASFALVRDESTRPIRFDPRAEALRGLRAAQQLRGRCGLASNARVAFIGVSMGGMEALLAARYAPTMGAEFAGARAVVLDPIIAPEAVAANLDRYWRSLSVDAMQAFFRRILVARYSEPLNVSFSELLGRTRRTSDRPTLTDPEGDTPARWLCRERVPATIFLSSTDPALGDEQREAIACPGASFARRDTGVPGHIPLGCNLDLFRQIVAELP